MLGEGLSTRLTSFSDSLSWSSFNVNLVLSLDFAVFWQISVDEFEDLWKLRYELPKREI